MTQLTREKIILQHVLALGNATIALAGRYQCSCPVLARTIRDVVTVHLGASHQHTRLRAGALWKTEMSSDVLRLLCRLALQHV